MSHRFVRCPHCRMPHDAEARICPSTGFRIVHAEARDRPSRRALEESASGARGETRDRPSRRSLEEKESPRRQAAAPPAAPPRGEVVAKTGTPAQRDLFGKTISDRYRVKGVLGEGGMGTVYDAEHLGLGRQVAIKVLSPTQAKKKVAVKRFQQEARAAGAIGHPNICEVYDLGQLDDGSPYLVMEKLVGQTLADRIGKEGGLPFEDVIEVAVQVLSGLVAAHEKGIVHRDIKPENIFLARRSGCPPIVKLLDFGVSKMMPEFQTGEDALDLTRTGMVMGTPYYMSPEQARGERNLDGRVDVYATGVVMYEAIAGKRPFLAPNYNALLLAIINTNARSLREVRPSTPPELEAIVMRAMAKNRADRYPTAKHLLRELTPGPAAPAARREPLLVDRPRPGPGATLQNSMVDRPAPESATRIEIPRKAAEGPRGRRESSRDVARASANERDSARDVVPDTSRESKRELESVDIPIHVELEDDTELFHPGRHAPPRSPRHLPAAAPLEPPEQPRIAAGADDDGDDFDATIVKHSASRPPPAPLPPARLPAPSPSRPQVAAAEGGVRRRRDTRPFDPEERPYTPDERPFNPDETMKLDRAAPRRPR